MDERRKRLKPFLDSPDVIETKAIAIGDILQKLGKGLIRQFVRPVAGCYAVRATEKCPRDRRRKNAQADQGVSSQLRGLCQMFLEPRLGQRMGLFARSENL